MKPKLKKGMWVVNNWEGNQVIMIFKVVAPYVLLEDGTWCEKKDLRRATDKEIMDVEGLTKELDKINKFIEKGDWV